MNFEFFVYCNIVSTHTYDDHTGFTFIWFIHSFIFQLVLLVETAYTIVDMMQVINKEARAT